MDGTEKLGRGRPSRNMGPLGLFNKIYHLFINYKRQIKLKNKFVQFSLLYPNAIFICIRIYICCYLQVSKNLKLIYYFYSLNKFLHAYQKYFQIELCVAQIRFLKMHTNYI
jgi:hypothetical protein